MRSKMAGQAVRRFSMSAVRLGALEKPPIAVFGLEGRYATALYSAAFKQKQLETVDEQLTQVQGVYNTNKNFSEFLCSPIVGRNAKKTLLVDVLGKMKCSPLTVNFFSALADNGRLAKVNPIIGSFQKIMSAHRGEVTAEITTAKPLDQNRMKELNAALQSFLKEGQTLKVKTSVDPALIGGMTVSVGDRYVDMSIASKVKKYENVLRSAAAV